MGNAFSHITLKKSVCDFPYWVCFFVVVVFFYSLLKFDIVNANDSFCKRGHNLKTEAKLNKAGHSFLFFHLGR